MRDAYGRTLRTAAALAAGAALLAGCSSGGGDDGKPARSTPSASASAPSTAKPTPTALDFTADPKRVPKNAAEGRRLALAIVAGPESWGPDFVKRSPYLSDPDSWPVLDANCEWETGTLPRSVLASVTAHSEIPAAGGKGSLRVAATVTVHRTESDADWEMAETLEEALRCPDQQLRQGERITGLGSLGMPYGVGGNGHSTDSLSETGSYVNDAFKGRQGYNWYQVRIGQVTMATVVKGAPGRTEDLVTVLTQAQLTMEERVKAQMGVAS
ncbi:hypothetical protein GCM10010275_32210 [Streptomyces litmocidini]|uniref:hypothetical protein n=1 Tax=Streptomyces litmocidini TaxID=67318 RepID=UPI0019AF1621|nr:hypothetical protein [Streptomyces litmocidini]GGU92610.1 hypothetical protein GCM10010275_32210 [Streptomyces litmocidini]